mgnify:CR=1 FL=1
MVRLGFPCSDSRSDNDMPSSTLLTRWPGTIWLSLRSGGALTQAPSARNIAAENTLLPTFMAGPPLLYKNCTMTISSPHPPPLVEATNTGNSREPPQFFVMLAGAALGSDALFDQDARGVSVEFANCAKSAINQPIRQQLRSFTVLILDSRHQTQEVEFPG